MGRYQFTSSRELFEAARDASIDAERCRAQLDALEQRAVSIGSPSFDAHVKGGSHDRVARSVANLVDREAELHSRIERDYDLIDAACEVLYGRDGMSDGLAALMPPWVADALYQHYLALHTWPETAALVMYCAPHVRHAVSAAFDLMDSCGLLATVEGHGTAEG